MHSTPHQPEKSPSEQVSIIRDWVKSAIVPYLQEKDKNEDGDFQDAYSLGTPLPSADFYEWGNLTFSAARYHPNATLPGELENIPLYQLPDQRDDSRRLYELKFTHFLNQINDFLLKRDLYLCEADQILNSENAFALLNVQKLTTISFGKEATQYIGILDGDATVSEAWVNAINGAIVLRSDRLMRRVNLTWGQHRIQYDLEKLTSTGRAQLVAEREETALLKRWYGEDLNKYATDFVRRVLLEELGHARDMWAVRKKYPFALTPIEFRSLIPETILRKGAEIQEAWTDLRDQDLEDESFEMLHESISIINELSGQFRAATLDESPRLVILQWYLNLVRHQNIIDQNALHVYEELPTRTETNRIISYTASALLCYEIFPDDFKNDTYFFTQEISRLLPLMREILHMDDKKVQEHLKKIWGEQFTHSLEEERFRSVLKNAIIAAK